MRTTIWLCWDSAPCALWSGSWRRKSTTPRKQVPMKAEDIYRLWNASQNHADVGARIEHFARACEQHGIARTKAQAGPHVYPSGEFWRALDAEIAKENEDG